MKFFKRIWLDIQNGENADVYLTLALALIVGVASIFASDPLTSLTLAVLALLTYSVLGNRRRVEELVNRFPQITGSSAEGFLLTSKRPDLAERLRDAKTIAINGITLSRTTDTFLNLFKKCYTEGGSVRLLIVDPNHPALEISGKRFYKHQDVNKLKREVEHTLDNFDTLLAGRKPETKCEVGLLQSLPPYSIWLLDVDSPKAEIWVEIYSFQDEIEPTFHLLPLRDGKWFDFFHRQFEQMWVTRIPWEPPT